MGRTVSVLLGVVQSNFSTSQTQLPLGKSDRLLSLA